MNCLKTIPRLSQNWPFFPSVPFISKHHYIQHTELPDSLFPWFKEVLWTMISTPVSRVSWEPAWQNDQHTWHFWETPLAFLDGNRSQTVADFLDFRHYGEKKQVCICVCVSLQIYLWLVQRKTTGQNIFQQLPSMQQNRSSRREPTLQWFRAGGC